MAWDDTAEQRRIRRRRRRRIRGPLTLAVLLGLVAGAGWFGWHAVLKAIPGAGPDLVCSTPAAGQTQRISATKVVVNVYNASKIGGLAERTATDLRQRGFTVGTVANDPKKAKVKFAEVRGRAKDAPEVILVAAQVAKEKVSVDNRTDASVDLVLGTDFHGFVTKAPTAMDVTTTVPVCVKPSPTAPGDAAG
ncbi:LytR cell envelope-related transcriptional attenuator [Actinopolymorpha cephalotaxi]|uniref:LytR cell envelope-related transcriptional attenuator n=1 Tax=Actinopolymorpha cephalotaxi TaxID=504797 RepID=A0A1I2MVA5_9ACTN|nr:LytR C-terminal domain-containing protein [Actinopolymorpha cephalotaxi]NYH85832.1 hypothetical protein [Actinopolymorpha cephalotaxi]SFF95038.1 LytR cell envelope-related transcriptional attenuator [Actinopolymorpha cephalotaxi]